MADILTEEEIDTLIHCTGEVKVDDKGNPMPDPTERYYKKLDGSFVSRKDTILRKRIFNKYDYEVYKYLSDVTSKIKSVYEDDGNLPPAIYINFMVEQMNILKEVLRYFWKNKELVEEYDNVKLPKEDDLKELYFNLKDVISRIDNL